MGCLLFMGHLLIKAFNYTPMPYFITKGHYVVQQLFYQQHNYINMTAHKKSLLDMYTHLAVQSLKQ